MRINYSKIYSVYKLGLFNKCPKRFHFNYVDPVYSKMKGELKKDPNNIWSFNTLGSAVHDAITLFYHQSPGERTKESLSELLKKTWTSDVIWNKKPPLGKWGGFKTLEEEREFYSKAILMLKNFYDLADKEPEIEHLPTQNLRKSMDDYINLITPLNDDFDISGKFDLITKEEDFLHVIDFKTGKREEEDHFQLRFYKLLAEKKFEKPVARASYYFLRSANKKRVDLQDEGLENIENEVLERIYQIKNTDKFETKPGKLCKFCLFKTFCPEKEKVNKITKDVGEEGCSDDLPF